MKKNCNLSTRNFNNRAFNSHIFSLLVIATVLFSYYASAQNQDVIIQQFSARPGGEQVTPSLPIYTVHFANGKLVDELGATFNSYLPQSTTSPAKCACAVQNLNWKAYNTTFYVVLANDPTHMLLVKSCGKSPLQRNTFQQYPNIKYRRNPDGSEDTNFINHAQIATINGTVHPVIAAGEIDVVDGKIVYIDTNSGHFRPNVGSFLAYMSNLDNANVLALTSALKDIKITGTITPEQISRNFTLMKPGLEPTREIRSGTQDGYSYTTVFAYATENGITTLSGGLLAYQFGNINIFQSDINTITSKKSIKSIELTNNVGVFTYNIYVVTDLHLSNDTMYFNFTDESPDTYSLTIYSFISNHNTDYWSSKPNINKITIHN